MAANTVRGIGGADPLGQRCRPLAIGCDLHLDGAAGRLCLSSIYALGLGWWLAGATRCQLWLGPRLCGSRGRKLDSSAGWLDRFGYRLDLRPPARQIFSGRNAHRRTPSHYSLRSLRLPARLCWMDRVEISRM